jgi:hypothetical protein
VPWAPSPSGSADLRTARVLDLRLQSAQRPRYGPETVAGLLLSDAMGPETRGIVMSFAM